MASMEWLAGRLIAFCWLTFFAVWIVASFFTKRTAERAGWLRRGWIAPTLLAAMIFSRRTLPFASGMVPSRANPVPAITAGAITGIGLLVAVWARLVLGGNWSADVALKEQHELIERGPYRFVRHPIYTGVLLMVLGTMLLWGSLAGAVMFGIVVAGLFVKALGEERLLTKHFPDAYRRYRERVTAALIPFVL